MQRSAGLRYTQCITSDVPLAEKGMGGYSTGDCIIKVFAKSFFAKLRLLCGSRGVNTPYSSLLYAYHELSSTPACRTLCTLEPGQAMSACNPEKNHTVSPLLLAPRHQTLLNTHELRAPSSIQDCYTGAMPSPSHLPKEIQHEIRLCLCQQD